MQPHPLQPLIDLAERAAPGHPSVAGTLTYTYPEQYREDLGRTVCMRFPNGGATGA